MSKVWGLIFGTGNPQTNAGLSPTLTMFRAIGISTYPSGVTDIIGPTISELGSSSGIYTFQYPPSATYSVFFVADGGSGLSSTDRYLRGVIDPIAAVDEKVGTPVDAIGGTLADPETIFALTKRAYGWLEGNKEFDKAAALWTVFSKGSTFLAMGASTILMTKTLTNTVSEATST